MVRSLLLWGMLAGLCGGLLAAGFAELTGETAVGQAISFEESRDAAAGEAPEPELISRGVQRFVGLPVAAAFYGVALGGVFALAFALAYGRLGNASPARTALWMAAAGFVVVFLVPFLKYPANPPSVGNPDTIGSRTELYLVMIAISIAAALAATRMRRWLATRSAAGTATLGAIGFYLALVIGAGLALPAVNEVPQNFPAETLWHFREAAIGVQVVLWAALGLGLAAASERVLGRQSAPAAERATR